MTATVALVAILAGAISFVAARLAGGHSGNQAAPAALPATPASYLGVYERGAPATYAPVAHFGAVAGRRPNLAGYFSGWPEAFQASFARTALHHGAATLVQMDPTDASVEGIAAGNYDAYLRAYAVAVRDFRHPVVLGFGHEMNAPWYMWGYKHVEPRVFVAAWRHIVTVFRQQGADNVTWLWTIQADEPGTGPIARWWPGARYVTWVGIDGYYFLRSSTFVSVFGATIAQVRLLAARKPILISETAVGPAAGQAAKIPNLLEGMSAYRTLGVVWFDIAQHNGLYHQNWRIEGNSAAEAAFRLAVREDLRRPG